MKTRYTIPILSILLFISLQSCVNYVQNPAEKAVVVDSNQTISEQEVLDAQQAWGEGIVKIGKAYTDSADYVTIATDHINNFYGYKSGLVLFKPTLASVVQFRTSFDGALSYFVAGNPNYPEDHGFAIKPWSNVRWESTGIIIQGNMAVAMGNYYFTPARGGDEVKVEYSFAYTKNTDGQLSIVLHDSHLPYKPKESH
ncbi:MAG: hypothetical protein Q8S18_06990 [Bacteroidales bacterium]|nr:hypothetical protein [Bacteroidales bacterium]